MRGNNTLPLLVTVPTIAEGLAGLGVAPGMSLLVHCSLSSFGRVQGGAQAVIEALTEAVGEEGTVVMPALTSGRFDPSEWRNPPVAEALWDRIRFETPLYHPQKTPTDHTMSVVYELFRTWPGTIRTTHPHSSMAAWGKHRDSLVAVHRLDDRFGESSPLARLYHLDARVLFLGTTYATNTCFHLAEYRRPNPPVREFMIVRDIDGQRTLHRYIDVDTDSSVFEAIGAEFEAEMTVHQAKIGEAPCRLFSLPDAVDFAAAWLTR
jgi:aminoglycoside 3-N-acetyltransferase